MKVYLHEIKETQSELQFSQEDKWVSQAVARVDETAQDETPKNPSKKADVREIHAHFNLRKVDEVVVISGEIETEIRLVCSRCATLYSLPVAPHFSALFCKDPVMAGVAHLEQHGKGDEAVIKRVGQNKGFARHAHDSQEGLLDSGKDLDITYINEDHIDLADVVTEQLQFQVPFQPLCSEDCKGICAQCGADLNKGRCACAKLSRATPFAVLKNIKIENRGEGRNN